MPIRLAWIPVAIANAASAQQVTSELFVAGLTQPLYVTHAPGDASRIFVVEKEGRIKTVDLAAREVAVYLDISDRVSPAGEGGLLGLAFHPEFEANGYLYVNTTRGDVHEGTFRTLIERYTALTGDEADPASAMPLLRFGQDRDIHNGGWMGFGPSDGYLYIATGDGGARGYKSQELWEFLGKMLRIDVDGDDFPQDSERNYAIPPDNPLIDEPGALGEIWASGLRNPWRCGFDAVTGDLYIGDVGAFTREELDFQPASSRGGENYGWPCWEGLVYDGCDPPGLVLPIHDYGRDVGQCITGGEVYRGCGIEGLEGTYFFADVRLDRVWSMRVVDGMVTELHERTGELAPQGGTLRSTVSFGLDAHGEIYYTQFTRGEVHRIIALDHRDVNGNGVPDACECLADVNGDGVVDLQDFWINLARWSALDQQADWDLNGAIDTRDLIAYLNDWARVYGDGGRCP